MTAFEGEELERWKWGLDLIKVRYMFIKKCQTVKGGTVCGEITPILLIWRFFKLFFHIFLLSYFHWQELSHAHDYAINYWAPLWFSVWDML